MDRAEQNAIAARKAEAVRGLMPTSAATNVLVAVLMGLVVRGSVDPVAGSIWLVAVCITSVLTVLPGVVLGPLGRSDSEKWVRFFIRATALTTMLRGASWAVGIALFFPDADFAVQLVMGLTLVGLAAGGGFGLSPIPAIALPYIAVLAIGGMGALLSAGMWQIHLAVGMLVLFFVYLSRMILSHARLFSNQIRSEIESQEQRKTIAVLLKEFEQNTSDWLWQIDAEGRFINVGSRFADAAGTDVATLARKSFKGFFGGVGAHMNAEAFRCISQRTPMDDVLVRVNVNGTDRYWSLAASPQWRGDDTYDGFRGVAADVTEKVAAQTRLEYLAHTDQLTGLANRTFFNEIAKAEVEGDRERGAPSLIAFDLTGFKMVNDTLGHDTGDQLLAIVGQRVQAWLPQNAVAARVGGDEFAILVPAEIDALAAAQELLRIFESPFQVPPHSVLIDASAGVATATRSDVTFEEMMKNADLALYRAKERGRGIARAFDPIMTQALSRRQAVERALQEAVLKNEFSLQFQPIVSIKEGRVRAYEALLRWNSEELGRVAPDEFIPIAEDVGLIVSVGEWVLETAATEAMRTFPDADICVNVSPVQLRNSNLGEVVSRVLKQTGLPPSRLTIEITEGVLLDSSAQTKDTLHNLLALGVQIALDDFGTGYSSLSYLRHFPFSKIKIDKSFVADAEIHKGTIELLRAIVRLAEGMGFEVVAEGIETHRQLGILSTLGCDYAQGYLFSKPLAVDEIAPFAARFADMAEDAKSA